jgi:acyl-CoA synthetase (AMP-forming)/AMP-acid ligase II
VKEAAVPVDLKQVEPPPRSGLAEDVLARARTLPDALEDLVARIPDVASMTFLDRRGREHRATVAEIHEGARHVHGLLRARGLERGEPVVVCMHTSLDLVRAFFGISCAGGVPALLAPPAHRFANLEVHATRLLRVIDNAGARLLYADDALAADLARVPGLPADLEIVGPSDAARAEAAAEPVPVGPRDLAAIQYSSGSTGAPKGVELSHGAVLENLRAFQASLGFDADDVHVNWAPLYHDMGLVDTFLLPLVRGCHTVLIPTPEFMRQPALWLWALHHYRGTASFAPNMAYALCARRIPERELEGLDLSAWRTSVVTAEPILHDTMRAFAERFAPHGLRPTTLTSAYGMAENVTCVTSGSPERELVVDEVDRAALARDGVARERPGDLALVSSGRPVRGTEVEIRDPEGRVVPDRCVGEIWFRGSCLFAGYRGDRERTEASCRDGWFRSGDLGYLARGELFFVSRAKDVIVLGGEKRAPQEVEEAVNEVPGVRTGCAVAFGVLNEARGTEDLAAVAETKERDPVLLQRIEREVRARVLAATGLPLRHLLLVPPGGVEKTTSGKLARAATRERYADRLRG